MTIEIRHEDDNGQRSLQAIGKGKRTKRQRPPSPLTLTMACSSSDDNCCVNNPDPVGANGDPAVGGDGAAMPASSEVTDLEEDMANCLMLLAQGGHVIKGCANVTVPTGSCGSGLGKDGFRCKTCDRSFPSFQALGGHRASHKKPRINGEDEARGHHQTPSSNLASTELSLQIVAPAAGVSCNPSTSSNKSKAHECSICGTEFGTGQALGGHMRRHRQPTPNNTIVTGGGASLSGGPGSEQNKGKNVLQLDLNLPAPEDRESKYGFPAKGQVLVFSASPLVDCPY